MVEATTWKAQNKINATTTNPKPNYPNRTWKYSTVKIADTTRQNFTRFAAIPRLSQMRAGFRTSGVGVIRWIASEHQLGNEIPQGFDA